MGLMLQPKRRDLIFELYTTDNTQFKELLSWTVHIFRGKIKCLFWIEEMKCLRQIFVFNTKREFHSKKFFLTFWCIDCLRVCVKISLNMILLLFWILVFDGFAWVILNSLPVIATTKMSSVKESNKVNEL